MRKRRGEWGADAGKRGRRDGDGHKRITSRGEGERGEKGMGEGGGGAGGRSTNVRAHIYVQAHKIKCTFIW